LKKEENKMQQPMETIVKSYKNAHEFQKDQVKMAKQGWSVANTTSHQQNRSLAGKLLMPGGMFTKGKSELVITYQRPTPQKPPSFMEKARWQKERMPKGLSFREQIQWQKENRPE
jgi:hypothetical protein